RAAGVAELGVARERVKELGLQELFEKGLGNQVGLHICDSAPLWDLNVPGVVGQLLGTFSGSGNGPPAEASPYVLIVGFVAASLTPPAYVAFPVEDAQVVDRFLDRFDRFTATGFRRSAGGGLFNFEQDFYRFPLKNKQTARSASVK